MVYPQPSLTLSLPSEMVPSPIVLCSPKSTSINKKIKSPVLHGVLQIPQSSNGKVNSNSIPVRRHPLRAFLFRNHVFLHDAFVPLRRIQSFLEDVPSRISVFFTILMISLTLPCCHPSSAVTLFVISFHPFRAYVD